MNRWVTRASVALVALACGPLVTRQAIAGPDAAGAQKPPATTAVKKAETLEPRIEAVETTVAAAKQEISAVNKKADAAAVDAGNSAKEAGDAKAAASEAKTAAAEATNAAKEADDTVALLRGGKLISSGITGGVALAFQFLGPFNNSAATQTTAKGVAMPYVLALPGYWGTAQATRDACASSWNGGDDEAIDKAARAVARKHAARAFDIAVSAVIATPNASDETIKDDLNLDYHDGDRELNRSIVANARAFVAAKQKAAKASDPAAALAAANDYRTAVIDWMAGIEWAVTRRARCWTKRFGLWVGLPLAYDATTTVTGAADDSKKTASRTITPTVAFGVAFTPNAYLSLLAGVTAASVTRDDKNGTDPVTRTIWATTVAIGGNLDVVSALAK